jgi:molybdenum cofactor cytidylyltransferase
MAAGVTQWSPAPVGGIVVAAGLSTRMGRFKLTLPWDSTTVIGRVVQTLEEAGLEDVVVVTGHRAEVVTQALTELTARTVYNPRYDTGEMLSSIQVELLALRREALAALICLGDQPQMEVRTVRAVLAVGDEEGWQRVVVPSHRKRAGHPILLPRSIWPKVLKATGTLRNVMKAEREHTRYVDVDTPTVLADLDTLRDYGGRVA